MSDSLRPHGLYSPWNSPGQNTGVSSLSLLQGIFPTQGLNSGLLHCRWILYQLSHKGSPTILEWVAYPFSRGSSWTRNQTGICIAGDYQLSYQGSPHLPHCKSTFKSLLHCLFFFFIRWHSHDIILFKAYTSLVFCTLTGLCNYTSVWVQNIFLTPKGYLYPLGSHLPFQSPTGPWQPLIHFLSQWIYSQ